MPHRFVESPHRTVGGRAIDVVVIHTMEIGRDVRAPRARARDGSRALPPRSRRTTASTPTSIVQCVREDDIAWHARGGNTNSIGIELAGFAGQRARELGRCLQPGGARAGGRGSRRTSAHGTRSRPAPPRCRSRDGRRGVTGHADVSAAFRKSDHWDPGARLPLEALPPAGARQRRRRARRARPEATSSSSARVITSGGEIWSPPPTSVTREDAVVRAFEVTRSVRPGSSASSAGSICTAAHGAEAARSSLTSSCSSERRERLRDLGLQLEARARGPSRSMMSRFACAAAAALAWPGVRVAVAPDAGPAGLPERLLDRAARR